MNFNLMTIRKYHHFFNDVRIDLIIVLQYENYFVRFQLYLDCPLQFKEKRYVIILTL